MNAEDHPLAGVLKNRNLSLRTNRLLILEWLYSTDDQTGLYLSQRLKGLSIAVEYVQCRSKADVLAALRRATVESTGTNVPIVHIEAHGEESESPSGFIGPDGRGGSDLLSWEELGAALRPLNMATRFNLMVVGAACYGEGLLLGIEPGSSMPFTVAIGYSGKVSARSLRDALLQFYRLLLGQQWPFADAIEAANREHHFDSDSELRETSAARLVLEGFAQAPREPTRLFNRLGQADRERIMKTAVESGWAIHFAFDTIQENRKRFEIDVDELIRVSNSDPDFPD